MSDKKTHHVGQTEEQPLEQSSTLPEVGNDTSPVYGAGEKLPSPTELLNDLLAGLEGGMQNPEPAVHNAASASTVPSVEQLATVAAEDAADQPAGEQTQNPTEAGEETNDSEPAAEQLAEEEI